MNGDRSHKNCGGTCTCRGTAACDRRMLHKYLRRKAKHYTNKEVRDAQ